MSKRIRDAVEHTFGDVHGLINMILITAVATVYVLHFFKDFLSPTLAKLVTEPSHILVILLLVAVLNGAAIRSVKSVLSGGIATISDQLRSDFADNLQHPERFVSPHLMKLYSQPVVEIFANARACLKEGIRLTHVEALPQYYEDTLTHFRKHHFLAVASASLEDIWDRGDIYQHMTNFIQGGGSITRVFIVKDQHKLDEREQEIIQKHVDCGVVAHISQEWKDYLKPDFYYFLVEENGEIALKATIADGKINEVTVTDTNTEINECLQTYQRMLGGSTPAGFTAKI